MNAAPRGLEQIGGSVRSLLRETISSLPPDEQAVAREALAPRKAGQPELGSRAVATLVRCHLAIARFFARRAGALIEKRTARRFDQATSLLIDLILITRESLDHAIGTTRRGR